MTTVEHARNLWRRGLSVIPVPRPRSGASPGHPGDGKVPAIPWRQYQHEPASEDQVQDWFRVDRNIAVVTGQVSGVVVIDADSPEAVRWVTANLPRTPWQTRTARGYHLWYGWPGVQVANRARVETRDGRLALDVRGDGGYVIGPGSLHASGTRYTLAGDWSVPREQLPRFWVGWLTRPARTAAQPLTPRPTGDLVERAKRYLAAIPVPEIGHGSDAETLYAAARLTRGFGLSESDATALLWDWAGGREGWSHAWVARKVHNALLYGTEAVGALR